MIIVISNCLLILFLYGFLNEYIKESVNLFKKLRGHFNRKYFGKYFCPAISSFALKIRCEGDFRCYALRIARGRSRRAGKVPRAGGNARQGRPGQAG